MKNKSSAITIGLDLGDKKHAVCVLDATGEILKQETITNSRASLTVLSLRYPVEHVSAEMQRDLLQIKLRDNLVRQRVDIIRSVRFTFKSLGNALATKNSETFARHAHVRGVLVFG